MCPSIHRIVSRSLAMTGTLGVSLGAMPSIGAVASFTDLPSWQNAAGSSSVETFTSASSGLFASPTFGPISFNGFSLSGSTNGDQIGIETGSVSGGPNYPIPATFAGQNFVEWGEGDGGVGPTTTIIFSQPVRSFGFDWFNTDQTDQYQLALTPQSDTFSGPPFTVGTNGTTHGFFGVVSDTYITSATISTQFEGGFVSDEGLDNIRVATAPPPPTTTVAWGKNTNGQLGNGTTTGSTIPVNVNSTLLGSETTAVSAGSNHSLAIKNGAVYVWGYNHFGQLGNGSTTDSDAPIAVTGLTSGVYAVAGGGNHSLAIKNGAVYAWGWNDAGQLGNGSNVTQSTTPVAVSNLTSGVTAIAAGDSHSLAIKNGAAYAWGWDSYGQLGTGSSTTNNVPVMVTGMSSGVTAIAAGGIHSLAIQNGAVYAWGDNSAGQLGNGTTTGSDVPVAVSSLTSGVTSIAGGEYHSLAIKDGNVWAWGSDSYGALGDGVGSGISTVPIEVLDLGVDLIDVAAGEDSSYALSSDGSLWVWGFNASGQLGLGDTISRLTPTQLFAPAGYKFTAINADSESFHAVALMTPVPEPSELSLFLGLGGLVLLGRRSRRRHV